MAFNQAKNPIMPIGLVLPRLIQNMGIKNEMFKTLVKVCVHQHKYLVYSETFQLQKFDAMEHKMFSSCLIPY